MKFIVNSQLFAKQLQSISGVITTSSTVPIINHFHFHLEENELTIKATDLETTLITKLSVETGSMSGVSDVAVPSKLLLDILKTLDDVPLTFSVDDSGYGIELLSGDGKYALSGTNPETYPALPAVEETVKVELSSSMLVSAISKTSFAASTDEMRQQMAGIFCEMNPEGITFVATDAHKLVRYRRNDVTSDEPSSFILPRKPINLVKNILAAKKDDIVVSVEYNHTNVMFTFDDFVVICRLVEGKYPNYEAAIPKVNPNKLTVDRVSLLNTLRRVGLFANQSTNQVRLSISENVLDISAEDLEFSNSAHEKLPCQYEGDPMDIGFNAKFLVEMLNNLDTENILMELSNPSRAGIIFPIADGEEEQHENVLMLVMPVMLAN